MPASRTRKSPTSRTNTTKTNFLPIFEHFGLEFSRSGTQHRADCPFCEREDHFYVNKDTGQFDCKSADCGKAGNAYTFLHALYLDLLENTTEASLRTLGKIRGLPPAAIKDAGFAYDINNKQYILPIYNRRGSLANLKSYPRNGKKRLFYNTPAPAKAHLFNCQTLANSEDTIFICEGEWDAIALMHAFSQIPKARRPKGTIVAVPGANMAGDSLFNKHILKLLKSKKIVLLYDNDDAGRKGAKKLANFLSSKKIKNLHVLRWPSSYPDKYDVSDHLTKTKLPFEKTWNQLADWIEPATSLLDSVNGSAHHALLDGMDLPSRTKFSDVLSDLQDHGLHLTKDLEGGIAITAAVGLSNELPGDPLWMFLVGPSGAGKSMILEMTDPSENYIFRTSTNYTDLLSGYTGEGEDNTCLIHKLIDHTFVIKDYTTILTLPHVDIHKMNGLLRDAYDGTIHRSWGNGKEVEIEGYFSIVAGVTNKIHTQQASNLGERFLKYEIAPVQSFENRDVIIQALAGGLRSAADIQNRHVRAASFCSFVDYKRNQLRKNTKTQTMPHSTLDTVVAMAQFVAVCRSVVERDRGGAPLYEPSPEAGTRLAKQLIKLPQALCHVYGLRRPDDRILSIIRKTAWDSAYSRIRTIYEYLYHHTTSDREGGVTSNQLVDDLLLPKATIRRTLQDMFELHLIRRRNRTLSRNGHTTKGRPEVVYRLVPEARRLYRDCGFE